MTNVEKFNSQTAGEEFANSVTHGAGALLAAIGTGVLITLAYFRSDGVGIAACAIYGTSMILLFAMSTLYHSATDVKVKKVMQVFDHSSVFLLILGTYTPVCLILLRGRLGWTLWGVNAVCTALGVAANIIDIKRWHRLSLLMYLLMGWSVIFLVRPLMALIPFSGFLILLAGGLCYSFGVIFYVAKKPRYTHAVWHLFVLAGAVLHYFFILFYVI